ncbi:MAG: AAA family ATPase [Planctomycetota bacterium]|jgi:Holliday junction DNA helicase RuvB
MAQLAFPQEAPQALALEAGLPFEEASQRIGLAYAAAGLKHRVVAFYLQDIHARGLHRLDGCRTAAQWAALRFGMSRREARDLLAAGQALVKLPEIDRAFAEGRLCWSKVRELIRVAVPEHEQKWLEVALRLHTDALHVEVQLSRKGDPPRRHDDRKGLPEIRLNLNATLPPDIYAQWEQVRQKLCDEAGKPLREWECLGAMFQRELARRSEEPACDGGCPYTVIVRTATEDEEAAVETADGPVSLDPATAETLACDAGVIDPDLDDDAADRRVPPAMRARVLARDRHRCRCCGSPHSLQMHHVIPWSKGGRTRMKNLISMCRTCHALVHAGLLVLVGDVKSCRFENARGRNLHAPGDPPEAFLPQPPPFLETPPSGSAAPPVRLQDVPQRIDVDWWHRHAHLIRWSKSGGGFEFEPGWALSKEEAEAGASCGTVCHNGVGTVCQPRPARLAVMVGQGKVLETVQMAVKAARITGEATDHMLLTGPPGLGKTTLARAVAAELDVRLHPATGSSLHTTEDLLKLLIGLGDRDVLFIDEVHTLPPGMITAVYEAMEDRRLSLTLRTGTLCRAVTLDLSPFTLIGATTDPGALPAAFLDRFVYRQHLDFYEPGELAVILARAAPHFGLEIESAAAARLGAVSRGTPRQGISLLRQLRNEAVADGRGRIDADHVARTLGRLGIDERGLGPMDRRYQSLLRSRSGPVGLGQASRLLGVDAPTLEREHEPYLIHLGLMTITSQGRIALNGSRRSRGARRRRGSPCRRASRAGACAA